MKKFLMYSLIVIVALFVGFTTYYFVATDEKFNLSIAEAEEIKLNVGDRFNIEKVVSYNKSNLKENLEIAIGNQSVLSYDNQSGDFTALSAGSSNLTITPSNDKFGPYTLNVKVGDGKSSQTAYYINTAEALRSISAQNPLSTLSMHYELTADIYLAETGAFNPIGNGDINGFTGTFNGANHTIYGLTITANCQNAGLFAKIAPSGVVKNLKINGAKINGAFENVGAVSGVNNGSVILCEVSSADITNTQTGGRTGGLVGINQYKMSDVSSSLGARANIALCQVLDLKLNSQSSFCGGIAGANQSSLIQNSCAVISSLNLKAGAYFGGITGHNSSLRITNNSSVIYRNAIIEYCHAINNASTIGVYVGGIAGVELDNNSDNPSVNNNSFARNYYVASNASAFGKVEGTASQNVSADKISAKTLADMKNKETYVNWDFNSYWILEGDYALINFNATYTGGNSGGSVDSDVDFDKGEDVDNENSMLLIFKDMMNHPSSDKAYTISENLTIDLAGAEWTPIGTQNAPFRGQLLVQDNVKLTVKNFKITNQVYSGFFGVLGSTAVVKGLNIEDVIIVHNNTTIKNVNTASGAIAGMALEGARILDSTAKDVAISASRALGGAVGVNYGAMKNVSVSSNTNNNLEVISSQGEVGALVGINSGNIENCLAENTNISINNNSQAYAGGFAGSNYGTLKNVSAKNVNIKEISAGAIYAGGIVGYNIKDVKLSSAYVVNIELLTTNNQTRAGGIAGYNGANGYLLNSIWCAGNIVAYGSAGACADNFGKILECAIGDEERGLGMIKGVHVAGLVYTNFENADCKNNLVLSVIGSTSNSGSANGVAYLMKAKSNISQIVCAVKFESVSTNCDFAESQCRFKSFLSGWLIEEFGKMEKCVIVDRGAFVQRGEYILDDIGIFGDKNAMIYKETEARGSDKYKIYTENGFSEAVWNFNYAGNHYPTLVNISLR